MAIHYVANVEDVVEGSCTIVDVKGISIGLYRVEEQIYALHNHCPHEGAELCKGPVTGTNLPSDVYEYKYGREGEIVRCPWHGWEFNVKTGKSLVDDKIRTRTYEVQIKDGKVGVIF